MRTCISTFQALTLISKISIVEFSHYVYNRIETKENTIVRRMEMATETFDKSFVITEPEALKKLHSILESDNLVTQLAKPPFSQSERDRSETLLKQCLSRSKH